jgi:hypothetical protein
MKKFLLLIICLIQLQCWSIEPSNWIALSKGGVINANLCVEADLEGNAYLVSGFDPQSEHFIYGNNQKIDANLRKYGSGYTNLLISKYNKEGRVLWSVPIEGKETVYSWQSHFGKDGCFYVGGNFRYDAVFHSTDGDSVQINYQTMPSYPRQFYRFFLAKYSADGKLLWVKTGNSHDNMACFGIKTDNLGNVYAWIYTPSHTMSIGQFSIFPSGNANSYIERNYCTIVKYNADGDEDWLFLSGDYFDPFGFWIDDENQLRILGNVGASKVYAYSTNGAEFSLDYDPDRKEILEFVVNEKGKLLSSNYILDDLKTGYARSFVHTDNGYVFSFVSGQFQNRKKGIAIANDSLYDQHREADLYLIAINSEGKVRWKQHMGGELHNKATDMLALKNGRLLVAARLTQHPKLYGKNNKVIKSLNDDSYKSLHLFVFDKKGRLEMHSLLGNEAYRGFEGVASLSGNDNHLVIGTNYSAPTTVFGKKLEPQVDTAEFRKKIISESALIHLNGIRPVDVQLFQESSIQINIDELNQQFRKTKKNLVDAIKPEIQKVDAPLTSFIPRDNEVFVFPNPVSSKSRQITVRLNLNKSSNISIELFGPNGEQIQATEYGVQSGSVDLQYLIEKSLIPGIYFLRIFIDGEIVVQKIVIT